MSKTTFESWLHLQKRAQNTISLYLYAVAQFRERYGRVTLDKLQQYKLYLIENFKTKTVNIRICGINAYLEYLGRKEWQLSHVKLQQKPYLENVISQPDYEYLRDSLLKDGRVKWHFVVRFLAATGARISELLKIKVEHVRIGYLDINSKGGKTRRIYIPESLRQSALRWLADARIGAASYFSISAAE